MDSALYFSRQYCYYFFVLIVWSNSKRVIRGYATTDLLLLFIRQKFFVFTGGHKG